MCLVLPGWDSILGLGREDRENLEDKGDGK